MLKWGVGEPYKKTYRIIMAIVVLVLAYAVMQHFMPTANANNQDIYIEHTVEPGETLWQIAQHYRPDVDPRQVVWEIRQVNDIGAVIYPGQVVRVPSGMQLSFETRR